MVNTKIDEAIRNKENALKEIERLKTLVNNCENYLLENEKIPIDSLREKLSESQKINEQIRARDRNRIADRKENKAKNEYDDFTQEINDQIKIKEDGLKENWHKIPDQKLSLTETEIAYDGTPFSQISRNRNCLRWNSIFSNILLRTIKDLYKNRNGLESKIKSFKDFRLDFIRQRK